MARRSIRRSGPRGAPAAGRGGFRKLADYGLAAAVLLIFMLIAARFEHFAGATYQGQARVNDGDTITIAGERLRIRGIDAPEFNQRCREGESGYPCGRRSLESLRDLLGAASVTCKGWERDRYGRRLVTCLAGDRDIGAMQVSRGWAVSYGAYTAEEADARAAKRGMWAGEFDRPSEWRARYGDAVEAPHGLLSGIAGWIRHMLGSVVESEQDGPGS